MVAWSPDPRWPSVTRSITPQRVSQRLDHGKVASGPRAWCRSSSLCTSGIYGSGVSPCIWPPDNLNHIMQLFAVHPLVSQ